MLSKEQIENLKELAAKATPGPWYVQYGDDNADMCMTAISPQNRRQNNIGDFPTDQPLIALTYHQQKPWVLDDEPEQADTNSEYIAAANPAVVIELIAMLEAAQEELQGCEQTIIGQGELLRGVANAIRGEPETGTSHSHHDLPERTEAVMQCLKLQAIGLKEAKKDAARYRWLETQAWFISEVDWHLKATTVNTRDAIDAAMQRDCDGSNET